MKRISIIGLGQAGLRHLNAVAKIKNIEIALNKIKLNEFGICIECGDNIALGRLEIDPTYTKCVNCA